MIYKDNQGYACKNTGKIIDHSPFFGWRLYKEKPEGRFEGKLLIKNGMIKPITPYHKHSTDYLNIV